MVYFDRQEQLVYQLLLVQYFQDFHSFVEQAVSNKMKHKYIKKNQTDDYKLSINYANYICFFLQ